MADLGTHLSRCAGDDALEVDASNEDRDMWRVYLDKGDYRAALVHCRRRAGGRPGSCLRQGGAGAAFNGIFLCLKRRPSWAPWCRGNQLHHRTVMQTSFA